jgi:hypothetical protein
MNLYAFSGPATPLITVWFAGPNAFTQHSELIGNLLICLEPSFPEFFRMRVGFAGELVWF